MQNNPATYFYVTNKHSVPTQICLDPNVQNQSRRHDSHFNIRTSQKLRRKSRKGWKILGKRFGTSNQFFKHKPTNYHTIFLSCNMTPVDSNIKMVGQTKQKSEQTQ